MMCKTLTLGSLFDGSGGFPLAGVMCGIAPLWASEIDPFCISVTSKRFPKMAHLGSITEINGGTIPPVDIITFGSPCQDLSVAGQRAGLEGERSGLFKEAVRIIKEMRGATNGEYPKYIVWENVPGAFSSNKGEDFRTVLEEIIKIKDGNVSVPRPQKGKWQTAGCIMGDGYSLAWRVLDAQFWGVPQRRKRIFAIGSFGNKSAAEILFKREGLRGDFKESRKAWENLAPDTENDTGVSGGEFTPKTLKIRSGCEGGGKGALIQENKSATLSCNNDQVLFSQIIPNYAAGFKGKAGSKSGSVGFSETVSPTLQAEQEAHCLCETVVFDGAAFNQGENAQYNISIDEETAQTLTAKGPSAVCCNSETNLFENHGMDGRYNGPLEVAPTVQEAYGMGGNTAPFVTEKPVDLSTYIVRRITPLECCRLQGFPDWWCADIPHKYTPEYRMWGNGVALPCVLYVLEGIAAALRGEQN